MRDLIEGPHLALKTLHILMLALNCYGKPLNQSRVQSTRDIRGRKKAKTLALLSAQTTLNQLTLTEDGITGSGFPLHPSPPPLRPDGMCFYTFDLILQGFVTSQKPHIAFRCRRLVLLMVYREQIQEARASWSSVWKMNTAVAVARDWTLFKQENIFTSQEELGAQLSCCGWCQGSWLWYSLSQRYCKALCSSTPATVSPLTSVSSFRRRRLCSVFIPTLCSVCKVKTLRRVCIAKPVSASKGGNAPGMGRKQLLCSGELWHGTTVGDFKSAQKKLLA